MREEYEQVLKKEVVKVKQQRKNPFTMNFTHQEKERIIQLAREYGFNTISSYIRFKCFGQAKNKEK